jgi:uncharacterized cupin superfamily protein
MPKVDVAAVRVRRDGSYPAAFNDRFDGIARLKLHEGAGLSDFGVNLLRLPPGRWSSQRHWHTGQDEFVWVLAGEVVLVTDAGETLLRAGDAAGFKAGVADGHHLQNRSECEAVVLEVGSKRADDATAYPDIDLVGTAEGAFHRDGTRYPDE